MGEYHARSHDGPIGPTTFRFLVASTFTPILPLSLSLSLSPAFAFFSLIELPCSSLSLSFLQINSYYFNCPINAGMGLITHHPTPPRQTSMGTLYLHPSDIHQTKHDGGTRSTDTPLIMKDTISGAWDRRFVVGASNTGIRLYWNFRLVSK